MSIHRSPTFIAFSLAAFLSILASFAYASSVIRATNLIGDPLVTERLRGTGDFITAQQAATETYKIARDSRQYAMNGRDLTEEGVETLSCAGCYKVTVTFLHDSEMFPTGIDKTTLTAYFYNGRAAQALTNTRTIDSGAPMSCDPEVSEPAEYSEPEAVEERDPNGNVGSACTDDSECWTPMSYMIMSNCPYGSKCVDNECRVVCSMFPDEDKIGSCRTDTDCSECNEAYPRAGATCRCLDNRCHRVEPKDGPRP